MSRRALKSPHERQWNRIDPPKPSLLWLCCERKRMPLSAARLRCTGGDASEDVRLERWAPGSTIVLDEAGGFEILVIRGRFTERDEVFEEQSWLRLPSHGRAKVHAGGQGARVWIKRGHLAKTPTWPR